MEKHLLEERIKTLEEVLLITKINSDLYVVRNKIGRLLDKDLNQIIKILEKEKEEQ